MKEIASATHTENEAITRLTAKAQEDSRVVKILTFVAMLYLPATLIAVSLFFSSYLCFSRGVMQDKYELGRSNLF